MGRPLGGCPSDDIVPSLVQLTKRCCGPGGCDDVGKYAIDTGRDGCAGRPEASLLFLDQIKREKGVWWMPWQQEAMKDVIPCVKPWGAGNRL